MRAKRNSRSSPAPALIVLSAAIVVVSLFAALFIARAGEGRPEQSYTANAARDSAGSQLSDQIAIEGWVTVAGSNAPIHGATVSVGSLRATTDERGYYSFTTGEIGQLGVTLAGGFLPLTVSASAEGYAEWTIEGARYYSTDTLRVYPRLQPAGNEPTLLVAARARLQAGAGAPRNIDVSGALTAAQSGEGSMGALGVQSGLTPPPSIRVYRTATGVVEVVPFREYVKHVLPNEWVPTWAPHALRAGAMAVKEYAWYWVARGGKQVGLGADVKDNTDDQVYDPNVSYASTDAAVDLTWEYAMTRNGLLFQAQYCAGSYGPDPTGDCPWPGTAYMTQWGSAYYADHARSWAWILKFYYPGIEILPTPPGGEGPPPATATPTPPQFTVGQGADNVQVFVEAYERNGGAAALGRPAGLAGWWLPYVTEHNLIAQPFSGPDGRGGAWIVYDVLTAEAAGTHRAYVLSGDIAQAYASHQPPGPEWLGAPTSDPYTAAASAGGLLSQGFERGTLVAGAGGVTHRPFPTQFSGWQAEYYPGRPPASLNATPQYGIPGAPALVADVPTADMDWPAEAGVPSTLGAGAADWHAQLTSVVRPEAGTHDLTVGSSSGFRLWVDHLLAVNAWDQTAEASHRYQFDFDGAEHTVRIQFQSPGPAARLSFAMSKVDPGVSAAAPAMAPESPLGTASLRVKLRWLGRGPAGTANWEQPLTLRLAHPSDMTLVATYEGHTDQNGVAMFPSLPAGTYNVHVKGAHSLQTSRAAIALEANRTTDVDMKSQVEGDVDGDNCVTVSDFQLVHAMVGAHSGIPGFDARADLNGDGVVSASDVSLLRSGFDQCGDISADTQLSALSAGLAPPLSQALAPWTDPEAHRRDLTMSMWASAAAVKAGDIVEVRVIANAGSQPVDGAAFVLNFNPSVLLPVDAQGDPTGGVEPGASLPSVYTNWVNPQGAIGYAAGTLQGDAPSGSFVLATVRFRALQAGSSLVDFATGPSPHVQLTYGGAGLLASVSGLALNVVP
ncbi:MAG TPA: SpoIID/LytB domain-containing protein [Chloroflexia bacterium]|nr:SpoIID/LytB domain-containing protein [Chloroflexia bacterium]